MLKETEDTIGFRCHYFYHWWHFHWGGARQWKPMVLNKLMQLICNKNVDRRHTMFGIFRKKISLFNAI